MRGYLYGIIATALVCAMIMAISPKGKAAGKLISMLCGLFLLLNVVKPLKNIDLSMISGFEDILNFNSESIVAQGVESSNQTLRAVIKDECEAYVMEKAAQMGASVSVDIRIADGDSPIPTDATVSGTISPYAKQRLTDILAQDLNIPKERQIWT